MKAPATILILAIAPLLWGSEVPDAIKGTWVVAGYRFAATSALSAKEAKAWIGRTLVVGATCVSLEGGRISSARFRHKVHDPETYFVEGFHTKSVDVGYNAARVHEYEITREDGKPWVEPGSVLLPLGNTEALTAWDGVFFVLKRKLPKRSALDARTALCFHIEAHWPGASESGRYAL
jgi:hypothetical protein